MGLMEQGYSEMPALKEIPAISEYETGAYIDKFQTHFSLRGFRT